MAAPQLDKIPAFYHKYVKLVTEDNLQQAMAQHASDTVSFLSGIPEDKWNHRYAADKWDVKEVVQHMLDTERIFCYRALTFARRDTVVLPGFDEVKYAAAANADRRKKEDLVEELNLVQRATEKFFASFDDDQLAAVGIANGNMLYVEAIGYIIIGHNRHHINVLKERYGI